MNQYRITITLTSGDEIQSKVAADNQAEALQRLIATPQVGEFIKPDDNLDDVSIEYLGQYQEQPLDIDRYTITPSKQREGWLSAYDSRDSLVVMFKQGDFQHTAEIKPLEDMDTLALATAIRQLGDWLRLHHPELL